MANILWVEDSAELRELVIDFFKRKGMEITMAAADGYAAMELIDEHDFDLAILDIMLPGPSGLELCKALRKNSDCPVIFLTALGSEDSILKGYDIGADEYMVKPFSLNVLYAKCLALLARAGTGRTDEKVLECGSIRLYPLRMEVTVDGKETDLAPKEYLLLKALMENKGIVMGRNRLLDIVWGDDFDGFDRVVDNHIKKLRRKLGPEGDRIRTVIGEGYKLT